ncbi:IS66 family insertion sequence element accessory protein TnpA [Sulfobacillus thermosulfidooxidans]|uniref:IS66 family insertion sequence element accessory protein TnpA n=1 Tax=Sulfobacillus thermosulfidooxidans TaxID=28034 RepID=UPI0006B672D3|nr:hypothetical protein [Sulfobacillus thermosulfidooxidans]
MTAQERETLKDIWYTRVQEFRASGLSGPQWCGPRGLNVKQLRYWNRKFPETDACASETGWLVMKTPSATDPTTVLEIRVGPVTIMGPPAFHPEMLPRIVQVLATCSR